jgi:hypothetical protein
MTHTTRTLRKADLISLFLRAEGRSGGQCRHACSILGRHAATTSVPTKHRTPPWHRSFLMRSPCGRPRRAPRQEAHNSKCKHRSIPQPLHSNSSLGILQHAHDQISKSRLFWSFPQHHGPPIPASISSYVFASLTNKALCPSYLGLRLTDLAVSRSMLDLAIPRI